jgi:hypothetical protein
MTVELISGHHVDVLHLILAKTPARSLLNCSQHMSLSDDASHNFLFFDAKPQQLYDLLVVALQHEQTLAVVLRYAEIANSYHPRKLWKAAILKAAIEDGHSEIVCLILRGAPGAIPPRGEDLQGQNTLKLAVQYLQMHKLDILQALLDTGLYYTEPFKLERQRLGLQNSLEKSQCYFYKTIPT